MIFDTKVLILRNCALIKELILRNCALILRNCALILRNFALVLRNFAQRNCDTKELCTNTEEL